ncbi:aminotransferase class III-fold pyridoxal phosphate-dependent enzyme [Marinobacterium jannaschii]|uniref:aminotransferase class III-fold pyridoxal phosphate-dependent enzyme n=1 Tax=Marinobacterium jannaschii TaxID=64970 RepID=UPI000483282F|nr:aminotransferase class III-fold pyridoxal phosphate-dependent enzyme [Marinobacterium jannaschii]
MSIIAIVQARLGSTRLPNKVIKPILGRSLISLLLERLSHSKHLTRIVLATTDNSIDKALKSHVESLGYDVYSGSEDDVLQRYVECAREYKAETVVRITGDCPLVSADIVDKVIATHLDSDADYVSNIEPPTYPDGLDVEVFSMSALEKAQVSTIKSSDREHVTTWLRSSPEVKRLNVALNTDYSDMRWTVDEPEDFKVIQGVFEHFSPRVDFDWQQVLTLATTNSELFSHNSNHKRNEGMKLVSGQKLWRRAKKVIPGGNMLLSKRPEMFLPEQWPSYFSKTSGCKVWDLDGNEFIDMSIMGIGTNTLGYNRAEVDQAVIQAASLGNMSTLNCPEEVFLAEKLVEIHPWADMARFARTGGEANAIAIRIARAASGKDQVAVCGYHGWHDWYLSANLSSEEELSGHLLPGLAPKGVPQSLRGSVLTFEYNDFEGLLQLVQNNDIGVIKMEVQRNERPKDDFLNKVRALADGHNIVLIFDESTSGFRQSFGGIHKIYGITPDMAIFGKTLGNGYAITATIGKRDIMEAAQSTFISSTFWTERIGPTAALKTLEIMEAEKSWDYITKTGEAITDKWLELGKKYGLNISTHGIPALTGFSFNSENNLLYKTFITQEMLKRGFLASTSLYVCTEHKEDILNTYFENIEEVFEELSKHYECDDFHKLIEGPVCHNGFKRLN